MEEIKGYAESATPPVSGNIIGVRGESPYDIAVRNGFIGSETEWLESLRSEREPTERIESLTDTDLADITIIEAIGVPVYIDDVSDHSDYGITDPGWYIFARIKARNGTTVSSGTTVYGAAGYIAEIGNNYIDAAVKFEVAAASKKVIVNWGSYTDTFIFKATDLAIRNLDYRVTFFVYDIEEFTSWLYKPTEDTVFIGTTYYTEDNGVYSKAAVIAFDPVQADTYYVHSYTLTEDETFAAGRIYYTKDGTVYTEAEVTEGDPVPADTYYVDAYDLTTDKEFIGTAYFTEQNGVYEKVSVVGGEVIPTIYYVDMYNLTEDETFIDGTIYYIENNGEYAEATVTPGETIPENTYYVHSYELAVDAAFVDGKTYYIKNDGEYTVAEVVDGEPLPIVHYVHSKVRFEGMTRNVTYRCNTVIDCPVEFVLPEIEDDCHGAWYEIRMRHNGSYSSTLIPPADDVKIATEHTQAETKGMNMVNLHYSSVGGAKVWRFMNTHSTFNN